MRKAIDYRSRNHRPWADYVVTRRDRVSPAPVIVATFADGERVQIPFATARSAPLNIGRGLRNVIACYRARMARRFAARPCDDGRGFCIDVPEISTCHVIASGASSVPLFPAVVSIATQDLRRGTFNLARVIREARERRIPLLASGDALDECKLIARRYQRAAARHLLAHPDLIAKYRAIGRLVRVRRIAMYTPDPLLNRPTTPVGRVRNQFMKRAKPTWHRRRTIAA